MVTPAPAVGHVACKLPDFWEDDPATWFAQCEGQFRIARVTSDKTQFDYVVQKLSSVVIKRVRDLILNPPEEGRYDAIKNRILDAYRRSQYEELRDLHATAALGDRRPTQLMDDILSAIPSLEVTGNAEPFVTYVFLSRLPDSLRSLVSVTKYDTLRELAEHADRLWTASGGATTYSLSATTFVNSVASNIDAPSPDPVLAAVSSRQRTPQQSSKQARCASGKGHGRHVCAVHRRWLHDALSCAKKCDSCEAPCSWPAGNWQAGGRRN